MQKVKAIFRFACLTCITLALAGLLMAIPYHGYILNGHAEPLTVLVGMVLLMLLNAGSYVAALFMHRNYPTAATVLLASACLAVICGSVLMLASC